MAGLVIQASGSLVDVDILGLLRAPMSWGCHLQQKHKNGSNDGEGISPKADPATDLITY